MAALIFLVLNLAASLFKPRWRLEAENVALRQQLIVLQRKVRGRVEFTNSDRLLQQKQFQLVGTAAMPLTGSPRAFRSRSFCTVWPCHCVPSAVSILRQFNSAGAASAEAGIELRHLRCAVVRLGDRPCPRSRPADARPAGDRARIAEP